MPKLHLMSDLMLKHKLKPKFGRPLQSHHRCTYTPREFMFCWEKSWF